MNPRMVSAREIAGKRIVGFEPGAYPAGEGAFRTVMHQPRIHLDDGSFLYFVTEEEPDGGDYGVFIGRSIKPKAPRR